MKNTPTHIAEQTGEPQNNVYTGVYHSLVIGMTASTVLFTFGVALALIRSYRGKPLIEPARANDFGALWAGLWRLDPISVLALATALLILTPISRVVVSLVAFAIDRDRTFVVITGLVLVAIGVTVALGLSR